MGYRLTLHFVDKETRSRAEGARMAFSLGHHAEVYAAVQPVERHSGADVSYTLHVAFIDAVGHDNIAVNLRPVRTDPEPIRSRSGPTCARS